MRGESTGQRSSPRVAGRYELRGVIGGGRTGIVRRAYDHDLGRLVAMKTLRAADAEALYRLKREFRTLARLAHPNLVPFFDLVVEGDERFFTMELIDGVDFAEHFRGRFADGLETGAGQGAAGDAFRELRDAVLQLAAGLDALHGHGILHRDVKPSNVLIARDGRVVLLDFGLSSEITAIGDEAVAAAGTMGYLAPEQLAGTAAGPASDWYGAGVMLYETLTGCQPFEGRDLLELLAGGAPSPTPPRQIDPRIPPDLDAVVMELLHRNPQRRPLAAEIVARLDRGAAAPRAREAEPAPRRHEARFVGRQAELAELLAALHESRRGLITLEVVGPSGIGKTALIERFAHEVRRRENGLVLSARCHPQEAIPFKALDGAIDDLARVLARRSERELAGLLPDGVAAARRIFPVLARVGNIARAIDAGGAELDPMRGRSRAFATLRELLANIAARQPLVLWIDDVQWGDLDSVALLRELRHAPDPPPLLLLLSFRSEDHAGSAVLDALHASEASPDRPAPRRALELGPLSVADASGLVAGILAAEGGDPASAPAIAAESQGSPLFAAELARHLAGRRAMRDAGARLPGIGEVFAARIAALPALARELLELVAVAGRPVDRELEHHARQKGVDLRPALGLLRTHCLVRAVPSGRRSATTTYHERIREAVLGMLPASLRRERHRVLAAALEADPHADPRLLVDHYEHAGETTRAGDLALAGARRAAAKFAFNQAAELYARALSLGAASMPRWLLESRLGVTLAYAGRGGEGAAHYAAAAASLQALRPDDRRLIALRRRAAELYLRSGLYAEGLMLLRRALADAGVKYPSSNRAALASILLHRVLLRLRAVSDRRARPSDADRERLEIYWSAGVGLSLFDMIRATDFQLRHALLAFRVGEPRHRARALATEAMTLAWEGGARNRRRSERVQADAVRFAASVGNPRVAVQTLVARAAIAFVERRFRDALALCGEGAQLCHRHHVGTTWEIANLDLCAASSLACIGDVAQLRHRLIELQQQAQERGDLYSTISLRIGFPNFAWLGGDDPGEARRQIAAARAGTMLAPFQEYCAVYAEAQVDLYEGDAAAGWRRTSAAWPGFRRSYLLRVQGVRIDLLELRARCALASATGSPERARLLRHVRRAARRLTRERVPWAMPLAAALRAGLACQRGDQASAVVLLADAASGFDALGMRMHAAAVRLHVASFGAGESVRRCADVMRELGAVNPRQLAALLVPGIDRGGSPVPG